MKNIFASKQNAQIHPHNKSLKILGPKVWNALPTEIKCETSLSKFKEYVKLWSGHSCKCNLCKSI